jgi:hypothetical protein
MAVRNLAFDAGSIPPSLAARVIALPSLGKILDILSQRFSLAARRYSKALPIILF